MNPYIIAEIGVNHDGSLEKAINLIAAAKASRASAVKFQSFSARRLATVSTPKAGYQKQKDGQRTHFEMLKQLELSFSDQSKIKKYCDSIGIEFMSTPYAIEDAEFLNSLEVKIFKIASADIVDLPLIEFISKLNKLTLISTGMASLKEIREVVNIFEANKSKFVLMHTTSEYPTRLEVTNIARLKSLKDLSPGGIGFSDHTTNSLGAIMATAIGCTYFEKHFTLDRNDLGPDHSASLEPHNFNRYVEDIQSAFTILGSSEFKRTEGEEDMAKTSRKSLHFSRNLERGHKIIEEDLILLRPGIGLMWSEREKIIGRVLKKNITTNTLISMNDLD
jgi:N,N'-diacetyllegionaminate synthase